jgi:hypothetical protein
VPSRGIFHCEIKKNKMIKTKEIIHELEEHLPFTITATLISMAFIIISLRENWIKSMIPMFYLFHPAHIIFSALVSSAIFYNYKKKVVPSILTGIGISLVICSLSDVFFPYIGSALFGVPISFHLPVLEKPLIILVAGLIGAVSGVVIKKTKLPHFLHVFISVFASLFYIFSYSNAFSFLNLIFILIITSISVVIPCCLGDIILPLIIQKRWKIKKKNNSQR